MSQSQSKSQPLSQRRQFLKTTAVVGAGLSTPYFFSTQRTLADEIKKDKMAIGVIGAGGMATGNIRSAQEWLNVVAVCDADAKHAEQFNHRFADGKADVQTDYRAMLDDDAIKIIHIGTPDHWHTKPLIEAMYAGKDVYCEKPLTLTIDEGKQIRAAQKETGRIVQVGTQQRSQYNLFVKAMAIVNEGRLGKIKRIQAAIGGSGPSGPIPVVAVPSELDWDRWLGPAPMAPYRFKPPINGKGRPKTNGHYEFRWWYQYSGGRLTDWGAHHVDISNWALKLNGQTEGPMSISGKANHPVEFDELGNPKQDDRYNTANSFLFTLQYPGGTEMVIRNDTDNGVLIEGDKGRIFVNRKKLVGAPVEQLVDNPLPEDAISKVYKGLPIQFDARKAHWANFLHCVREQVEPISDVHSHMEGLNLCHLAGISGRLGRDLKWDAENESIVGDEQANRMLARPYREGYEIEVPVTVS
ncbi:Inositol 2-dehydrogenase [Rubripirellula obstinata]|uniref:Inositol 2-dehydrogenase n=1 Tax=Rubripirellula obstinata TaxID=406547 RepID=A0A5B1CQP8_9BACT|nr:Gfo/Idh/MocA family oxidoreductase [Rubripirellula obstinata]KAA1261713.1 Inositol 2-dehydrogenase [Rubripirellula obstinata]